jgi:hypothetical protein
MNPQESSVPIQSPVESVKPEKMPITSEKKASPFFSIFLSILVLLLLSFVGYLYFTDRLDDLLVNKDTNTQDDQEKDVDDTGVKDDEDVAKITDIELKNSGWAAYIYPDYNFKGEIPSYSMAQDVENSSVTSFWKANSEIKTGGRTSFYPDYIKSISFKFLPEDLSLFACGGGCAKEHYINIDVFKNTGSKSLTDVSNVYLKSIEDDADGYGYDANIVKRTDQKWDLQVISYTEDVMSDLGKSNGYIVVTPKFCIRYIILTLVLHHAESYQTAFKCFLDSFVFEL